MAEQTPGKISTQNLCKKQLQSRIRVSVTTFTDKYAQACGPRGGNPVNSRLHKDRGEVDGPQRLTRVKRVVLAVGNPVYSGALKSCGRI